MGIAGDSKRGQNSVASKAAAEQRFADVLRRKSDAPPLTEAQLAKRRETIADIAAKMPEKPRAQPRSRLDRELREAGVEPLDAIFTRGR